MNTIATNLTPEVQFATLAPAAGRGALSIEYQWLNRARGDAPVAVFLHEGLGSLSMWRDWPQALCERLGMRGLVYSRPGYGRSTPRAPGTRLPVDYLSRQARDVLPALLDALGMDDAERRRMCLIGHSDGASIALLYAAAFPDAVHDVVVMAPHEFVEDVAVEHIAKARTAYETSDLRDRLARYHDDVDSAFYGWNDAWLSPAYRAWNIVGELPRIRARVLAIQGHDDHYGTMAQLDTIADHVRGTTLVKLERCGHSPHREATGAVDDAITAFLRADARDPHAADAERGI
jgi:pimeloyl-ACP methyl ester carboxylesterase